MKGNFSIVTPNYNMGRYLAETIESVLVNLKSGDQYFIIDGGSTDESLEIIRTYENRITGWVSEKDRGYADAIAKGKALSNAEYQCWINSGDLLLEGSLDVARKLLATTDADMIFGDDLYIDENGLVIKTTNGHVRDLAAMMLYGGWTPLQDACFWRREFYEKVGGIDPAIKYAADYDLFLRMSLRGNCRYVPVIFSTFRRHDGQTSILHQQRYKQERLKCRQREFDLQSAAKLHNILLRVYYWWKVRWRIRVFGTNHRMKHLVGAVASKVPCKFL